MAETHFLAILMAIMISLLSFDVDAQSTLDESESCASDVFGKASSLAKENLEVVELIKSELNDFKNLLTTRSHTCNSLSSSSLGKSYLTSRSFRVKCDSLRTALLSIFLLVVFLKALFSVLYFASCIPPQSALLSPHFL